VLWQQRSWSFFVPWCSSVPSCNRTNSKAKSIVSGHHLDDPFVVRVAKHGCEW
jgi:hypothetical protein